MSAMPISFRHEIENMLGNLRKEPLTPQPHDFQEVENYWDRQKNQELMLYDPVIPLLPLIAILYIRKFVVIYRFKYFMEVRWNNIRIASVNIGEPIHIVYTNVVEKINVFFRKTHIGPELRNAYHHRLRGYREGLSCLPKEMLLMILDFAFPPLSTFEKMLREINREPSLPIRANSIYGSGFYGYGGFNQEDTSIFNPGNGIITSHYASAPGHMSYSFPYHDESLLFDNFKPFYTTNDPNDEQYEDTEIL